MSGAASHTRRERTVPLLLNGGRVTETFREALFDAIAREGVSVNEFCLRAAAEKLAASGRKVSGVFRIGDIEHSMVGHVSSEVI